MPVYPPILFAGFFAVFVSGWDIVDRRQGNSSRGESESTAHPGMTEKKLNLIFPALSTHCADRKLQKAVNRLKEKFKGGMIAPGTKWCGSGSNAANYEDLGSFAPTDKCCRDHDNCPDIIEAGQTKHGLDNKDFYTKLHCDCDLRFKKCLKNNADKPSHAIGIVYFNVLNTQCFKEDFPIVKCAKYFPLTMRCSKYEKDTTAPKRYQYFDVPVY